MKIVENSYEIFSTLYEGKGEVPVNDYQYYTVNDSGGFAVNRLTGETLAFNMSSLELSEDDMFKVLEAISPKFTKEVNLNVTWDEDYKMAQLKRAIWMTRLSFAIPLFVFLAIIAYMAIE